MDDLEDVVEAVFDVEDIAEEIFEPEELLEDVAANPLSVLLGLVVAGAAAFTLLMGAVLLVVFAFRYGVVPIVAGLSVVGLLVTLLALGGFLYVRTGVPHRIQRKIDEHELEEALEAVITSEEPGAVLDEYGDENEERERAR